MAGELPSHDLFEIRTDMRLLDASKPVVTPTAARDFHHGHGQGGSGKTVVIRDSGIDDTHPVFDHFGVTVEKPDIEGLPTDGKDTVGHGTMVASLVVLNAPHVDKLVSVPIFGSSGRTDAATIRRSYQYITEHADRFDYVNDSWGASRKVKQIDQWHNEMEQAGVDSIVASGNTDQQVGSPATAERAFSVAGVTLDGRMARFSSPTDDLAALAVNVAGAKSKDANMGEPVPESKFDSVMQEIGGNWNMAPGTSFAAPRLAGYGVSYQTEQVEKPGSGATQPDETRAFEAAFTATAEDVKGTGEDGQGYLHYQRAVDRGTKQPPKPPEKPDESVGATVISSQFLPFGEMILLERDVLEDGDAKADPEKLKEAFGQ